jgi:hypothetical protein
LSQSSATRSHASLSSGLGARAACSRFLCLLPKSGRILGHGPYFASFNRHQLEEPVAELQRRTAIRAVPPNSAKRRSLDAVRQANPAMALFQGIRVRKRIQLRARHNASGNRRICR